MLSILILRLVCGHRQATILVKSKCYIILLQAILYHRMHSIWQLLEGSPKPPLFLVVIKFIASLDEIVLHLVFRI